jgi:two-component system, NarL family, nitrate/nitrite response regulator NarL
MAEPPRVLIVDDHRVLTQALASALWLEGFEDVTVAGDLSVDGVLDAAEKCRAEVVLLDLHLGEAGRSVSMIPPLVAQGMQVLVMTTEQAPHRLAECLEAGASGIFDKVQPFDHLAHLVLDAAVGRTVLEEDGRRELLKALRDHRLSEEERRRPFAHLTKKEEQVLARLLEGHPLAEIAGSQSVSIATVRTHVRSILQKLGVNSQLAAVVLAHAAGWLPGLPQSATLSGEV